MPKFFFSKGLVTILTSCSPKVVLQILQPVILRGMVCLSIFGKGVFMYVCIVSPTHGFWFHSWNISFVEIRYISRIIFLTSHSFFRKINVKCWNSLLTTWKETSARWWHRYVFAWWLVSRLGTQKSNHGAYVNVNPRSTDFWWKEEDEWDVLVPIKEGGVNLSQMLDNLSPLKVDKKKDGYVTRGSNKN
jgi:hypothetical protein